MYGSRQGRYAPGATRASEGRFPREQQPERKESPDTSEIVSNVLLPTGRQTQRFQIMDHQILDGDGLADCIIFTKDGIYVPKDHYLSTVPVEVVIRAAQVTPAKRPRPKSRPAASKSAPARKPAAAAKTTVAAKSATARGRKA